MTEPSGTPETKPDDTKSGTPETNQDDSKKEVTVSAQFKKEALENWKPAAERANQLERQLQESQAQLAELARRAYGGQAATDPRAELISKLQEQAQYDPVAAATLMNMQDNVLTKADNWLANEMLEKEVPKAKQKAVAALVKANGYQLSVDDALRQVTDPETKSLTEQLAESKKELDRLRNSKPNGTSPAATVSANTDSGEGRINEQIERAEYIATLNAARAPGATPAQKQRAQELMQAVGSNKTKFKD
jgi:hypothetical protein